MNCAGRRGGGEIGARPKEGAFGRFLVGGEVRIGVEDGMIWDGLFN